MFIFNSEGATDASVVAVKYPNSHKKQKGLYLTRIVGLKTTQWEGGKLITGFAGEMKWGLQ